MQVQALDLRPGSLVRYEGRMCTVMWWNILRNDRRLFVQMKIKDVESGRVTELKEHGDTKYEVLDKEEKELAYSYRDGPAEVFFTPEGEELRCPAPAAEDALKWPAESYTAVFVDGKLVAINPPKHAVLAITETAPPMKGGGSGTKEAPPEKGVKVTVNLRGEVGAQVRVETEADELQERDTM